MKALKIIGIIVLGLVALVAVLSFIAPTKMHAERSVYIKAPKEVVFADVKTFENFKKWSPWREKDTAAKVSISGTDGTVGAKMSWDGNKDMGSGEQTLTKIEENKSVETDLHFIKPFDGKATSYTYVEDSAGGTKVIWGFNSEMSRPFNVMGLFMNIDKAIGDEYDKGLSKLKALAEKEAADGAGKKYTINEIMTEPKTYIGIKKNVSFDKLTPFFAESYGKLFTELPKAGIHTPGPPTGLYYTYDTKTMTTDVAAVAPITDSKKKAGDLEIYTVRGGKTLEVDFYGDYKNLGAAHTQINQYIAEKKLKAVMPAVEEYITDPGSEKDPNKWLTKIYYFVD